MSTLTINNNNKFINENIFKVFGNDNREEEDISWLYK